MVSMVRVKRARDYFFSSGTVPTGLIPDLIVRSWQRSMLSGVPVGEDLRDVVTLSSHELNYLREKNRDLLTRSVPVMENLYEQIMRTSSKVLITDADGVVLHSMGDPDFLGKARRVSLQPGCVWSEEVRGTNAIGTALIEKAPVVVHNAEHFLAANHFLTCSASPICDPYGNVKGVLDVSCDGRGQQQHTMALVQISTQQIENQMFSQAFQQDLVLHFHMRPEFLGTLYEGIIVFSQDGGFVAANRSALMQLGVQREEALAETFSSLFNTTLGAVFAQPGQFAQPARQLRSITGATVYCRAKSRLLTSGKGVVVIGKGAPPAERQPVLEELELGDPGMQKLVTKARKVIGHDIPVLLQGESGTGKELFARALHYSGPRQGGPFVALNCAALPESLIESELFGYQEGAFTGAKRKGYVGKIRQAHGGTLFLDEIGDMPLLLQARLLRVLQERAVSPLGDTETYRVDFALVCATNKKIREEAAAGRFREDLYYRLNGLLITLPGLRDRADRIPLARKILHGMTAGRDGVILSRDVEKVFEKHPWPGNIRQMHNVLRTAVVLVGGESEITEDHLPEDFLEQYEPHREQAGREETVVHVNGGSDLGSLERVAIKKTIEECRGNMSAAARRLGISRNTLYRKWQKELSC